MNAIDEILLERARQIAKGYDAAHDDKEMNGQLVLAALSCLSDLKSPWPDWAPPKVRRDRLITAASLLIAEIERWDRALPSDANVVGGVSIITGVALDCADCDCVGAVIGQHDRSCPHSRQERP
ncbi:hypothetical protein AB7M49_007010 [Bradyrhizobium elkanii]